ncbi:MAG: hypothetical protein A2086_13005 [Spirochaetes bacterium GWD1_27_9]|nr:MAG: hypothetical protein A2Z98_13460 [Spirochaetes bacterium GWB1_27_13]OHD23921.1 MAG: hypothetical protein A2Y34_18655 [Spirochaetes bacterium GWC1_27_15]OHD43580.1 MAG: hypothetical protein A2086_13005 [Spirochaetes bacterium GWD1_27_9]
MAQKLTEQEISIVLKKIKNRYERLVKDFKKPRSLAESFEDRYLNCLKSRMDVTVFLLAEIEAVEEIIKKEEDKKALEEKDKNVKKTQNTTIADKIFEENRKKIAKYSKVEISSDADEEIERLIGGVREFINNYLPAIYYIYKDRRQTQDGDQINKYYQEFITKYDYKDVPPITRKYIAAFYNTPRDLKKIDYEHRLIVQETAFLLNDVLETLETIIVKEEIPFPERKIIIPNNVSKKDSENWFYEYFNGLTYKEGMKKVYSFLRDLVLDFRIKDIKRG